MSSHGALSIIADIPSPARYAQIQALVDLMEASGANALFGGVKTIHFARLVVLDAGVFQDGVSFPARLLLDTSYDLPLDSHIEELVEAAGPQLWDVFSLCAGFLDAVAYDRHVLAQYLRSHMVRTDMFYVGVGRRSVEQIRREHDLRGAIEEFADSQRHAFEGKDPVFIRERIQQFVAEQPSLSWALTPSPRPSLEQTLVHYTKPALVALAALLLSPVWLPLATVWLLAILASEIRDPGGANVTSRERLRLLLGRETGPVQAQFTGYGELKRGRHWTLLFLLRMANFAAPYVFRNGRLSDIPTVHFARWVVIDEGRQMLFLSNYDGDSEGYLRDFINIAAKNLTLLFSHSLAFPPTRCMIFGGAADARGFMQWGRRRHMVTNIWYSANPLVSVRNVWTNSAIREGLSGTMTDAEARNWLKKL
jgi:hypothetical protein